MNEKKNGLPPIRSTRGRIHFFSQARQPVLEILGRKGKLREVSFMPNGMGRSPKEKRWEATPALPLKDEWQFRIRLRKNVYLKPLHGDYFTTGLHNLWLQDGQIFNYRPAPKVSPSQVIKIEAFEGSLPQRPLYIYLPRGYNEQVNRYYPVLYMHDGQNCFEQFVQDSYAGSWKADQTADLLIGEGRMQECIIVGVSNGSEERIAEYLPPYATYQLPPRKKKGSTKTVDVTDHVLIDPPALPVTGRGHHTVDYYQYEAAAYLRQNYRILNGRDFTATCGSSMGGLFSTYIAWEYPEFARHHAILSPAYWITRTPDGTIETVERLRTSQPPDLRLWLDSGTLDAPGRGDDGMPETAAARDALLENGYQLGPNFQYCLDEGAIHHESAWAARLPQVFQFLFPHTTEF